jgi:hypothetical protein
MLSWKTLCSSADRRFFVKGTELAIAIVPGYRSRFSVTEVRALDAAGFSDVKYRIRDAELISDADVAAGKLPPIVFEHGSFTLCLEYCEANANAY